MRPIADLVGSELRQRLLAAPPQLQRGVAIGAATAAVLSTELVDALLDEVQAKAEVGQAEADAYGAAFRRARAAAAVKTCFDRDPGTALSETIYEAGHAVARDERLAQLLGTILDLVNPGNHWAAREFANLFWPRFIDVDGYVLLASHYSPDNLAAWRERRPDSRAAVETVINHVHLEDHSMERAPDEKLNTAGQLLTAVWRRTLETEFPDRPICVDLSGSILTAFSSV
jgi:hypothetical protein